MKQEGDLLSRAQQLQSREQKLELLKEQIEAKRHELDQKQKQASIEREQREREFSFRLEELHALQRQNEEGRAELKCEREQLEENRKQLASERQQLEAGARQLNEARRLLADASMVQVPEQFSAETLTLLANEFNAPLAGFETVLDGLLGGDHGKLPNAVSESLKEIRKANKHLCQVVADVLDIARTEHGQLALSVCSVSLKDALEQSEADIQEGLNRKGLSLSREGYDASLTIAADPAALHRILDVLLRNAVQYTVHGGITIKCSTQADRVAVLIEDTGVGIDPANLRKLFAKPQLGSLLHGKGISLYLARCLAKSMGADVTLVSSELEKGSTFAITLPKGSPEAAAHNSDITAKAQV